MRTIMIMVAVLVSTAFLGSFAVCNAGEVSRSKKNKIEKYLVKYGYESTDRMYKKAKCGPAGMASNEIDYKIKQPLDIREINSKEIGGISRHFVKCKIIYKMTAKDKKSYSKPMEYTRYMLVVVDEDGFGRMRVEHDFSEDIVVAFSDDEYYRKNNMAERIVLGEELIK